MATPDPEHVNFIIEHLGKIATGMTVIGLMVLKFFPQKREAAKIAQAIITETPVSHSELIECKMEIKDIIQEELKEFNKTFMGEIKLLHKRINNEIRGD